MLASYLHPPEPCRLTLPLDLSNSSNSPAILQATEYYYYYNHLSPAIKKPFNIVIFYSFANRTEARILMKLERFRHCCKY